MSLPLTRAEAWDLFCEWTASESLRRHVLAVEACMRAYAARFGEDEERWGLVGMLHDLDYERYPDFETGHPRLGMAELERLGFPADMVRAVASHADYLDVPRETPMEKTLYAVDELSGFVLACAYVRPTGLEGLTPKSVKKKMKTPAFAAAVDRDALRRGAEELGVDFDEHVEFVIAALQPHAAELGLDAAPQPADG
jgi:putative nucleotidyltransferase with HDIG domain